MNPELQNKELQYNPAYQDSSLLKAMYSKPPTLPSQQLPEALPQSFGISNASINRLHHTDLLNPYLRKNDDTHDNSSWFANLPPNYHPKKYILSDKSIKNIKDVFQEYDNDNSGSFSILDLDKAINHVFHEDDLPAPDRQDIAFLIQKYDFKCNKDVSLKLFRRLLKELVGKKKYSKDTIESESIKHSTFNSDIYINNYGGLTRDSHFPLGYLPSQFVPKTYPLSLHALSQSEYIYLRNGLSKKAGVNIRDIYDAIEEIYRVDLRNCPAIEDIAYFAEHRKIKENRSMSYPKFHDLLLFLSGQSDKTLE